MKKSLRAAALVLCLAAIAVWTAKGANRGWTKTSLAVKKLDEVTGIEGIEYRKQFLPGVDFLGAAFLGAVLLAGVSLLIPSKPSK